MTDGTYRPLGARHRYRLQQAIKHLRSPFHSVRVAAHQEIHDIIHRQRRLARKLGLFRLRRPRRRKVSAWPRRENPFLVAAIGLFRLIRAGLRRAQGSYLDRAERRADARAAERRQAQGREGFAVRTTVTLGTQRDDRADTRKAQDTGRTQEPQEKQLTREEQARRDDPGYRTRDTAPAPAQAATPPEHTSAADNARKFRSAARAGRETAGRAR